MTTARDELPEAHFLRRLLRWAGWHLGCTTWYHVAATYPFSGGGYATMSLTCSVRPWLHHDNYQQLVAHVKGEVEGAADVTPNIVSLTRLGA